MRLLLNIENIFYKKKYRALLEVVMQVLTDEIRNGIMHSLLSIALYLETNNSQNVAHGFENYLIT